MHTGCLASHASPLNPSSSVTCNGSDARVLYVAMLSFDIRSLVTQAAVVDEVLSGDDPIWEAGDPRPDGGLRVTGRLSAAGPGRFYWHGRIDGDLVLPCRRCLGEARAHVNDDAHLIFAEPGDEDTDDPDVYRLDPRVIELD